MSDMFNEKKSLDDSTLKQLGELCQKQRTYEGAEDLSIVKRLEDSIENNIKGDISIKTLEKLTSNFKEKLRKLSQDAIPSILNETGLSELKLKSGHKIVIKDVIKAKIADKNYMLAHKNMISEKVNELKKELKGLVKLTKDEEKAFKQEATDLIDLLFKNSLIIDNENISEEVTNILIDNDIVYDRKMTIAWQTLEKYCREQKGSGNNIPEGISTFEYQETKIK